MVSPDWHRKQKGSGVVWTLPGLLRAVVDTRGFGSNSRISYGDMRFNTVKEAKEYAEKELANDA